MALWMAGNKPHVRSEWCSVAVRKGSVVAYMLHLLRVRMYA